MVRSNPRGAAEMTHTWEDVERKLGDVIVTAMVALDTVNGDAPSVVDQRLRHLVQRVLGHKGAQVQTKPRVDPRSGRLCGSSAPK